MGIVSTPTCLHPMSQLGKEVLGISCGGAERMEDRHAGWGVTGFGAGGMGKGWQCPGGRKDGKIGLSEVRWAPQALRWGCEREHRRAP